MSVFPYQIALLGEYEQYKSVISATIGRRFADLGLRSNDYEILLGKAVLKRQRKAPIVAIFFGYDGANTASHPEVDDVLSDSVVILPIVDTNAEYHKSVPPSLININGMRHDPLDPNLERAVSIVLENFRFLRRDRRLFISYKRSDSSRIAAQLYDALDQRGFDVFLDTRGVPPGVEFQGVLWHRLADSDVVILLDTPHFFESRWTEQEYTRAGATNLLILHLLWPGRQATPNAALSDFFLLKPEMFEGTQIGDDAKLTDTVIGHIVTQAEALRARALSARHRYLVDAFCDEARRRGFPVDIQPSRHILLSSEKSKIAVVPVIGVPSSLRLHEVERELVGQDLADCAVWALYDERGLLEDIVGHLSWLNNSLPLHTVRVFDVATRLDALAPP